MGESEGTFLGDWSPPAAVSQAVAVLNSSINHSEVKITNNYQVFYFQCRPSEWGEPFTNQQPEGGGQEPDGTGPPSEGTGPQSEGTGPPSEGTGPPSEGTGPPSEGTGPQLEGTGPLSEGSGQQPEGSGQQPEDTGQQPEDTGKQPKGLNCVFCSSSVITVVHVLRTAAAFCLKRRSATPDYK